MPYPREIKDQEPQPTLAMRKTTSVEKLPQVLGSVYGAIMGHLVALGEHPTGPPYAAYFNMDMQALDVEIGFPVSRKLDAQGDMQPGEIPGGKVATSLFVGPYSEMEPAYDELKAFIEEQGHEATGVVYEMYLNDPGDAPETAQTLIVLPLKAN